MLGWSNLNRIIIISVSLTVQAFDELFSWKATPAIMLRTLSDLMKHRKKSFELLLSGMTYEYNPGNIYQIASPILGVAKGSLPNDVMSNEFPLIRIVLLHK
jgi:hypothetical protein